MLRFACPFCHFQNSVPESDAGGRIVCPACSKTVAIPSTKFDNGCIIGDFIIQGKIGEGSAGTVFLAQQISLEREVALKILSQKSMTKKGVATFLNEARAAAKLSHANLVQAYAVGEDDGFSYMAMTYIKGESLKARMKREKRIPVDEALHIVQQIAEALYYAWTESRLIHRDVKPDNIMLTDDGIAKLTDLGLAMNQKDWREDMDISGSPSYMSPEQFAGEPLDTRSDIYSLGVTLYQMITGSLPFRAVAISSLARQHFSQKPDPPDRLVPGLPSAVSALIKKMMAKKPAKRYADMEELLEAIWRLRQITAPNRSFIPDVHTISIKRLNYGIQTEYLNAKRKQERLRRKTANSGLPLFFRVLFALVPIALIFSIAIYLFSNSLQNSREKAIFHSVDAFERLAANPDIPVERLQSEANSLILTFTGDAATHSERVNKYILSHINYLLTKRTAVEIPAAGTTISTETINTLENEIGLLNEELSNLKTKVVPRLKEEADSARKESESLYSQIMTGQMALSKSQAEYNAVKKAREEERSAMNELKINAVRQRIYQLVLSQRFSGAQQMLTTEALRNPTIDTWCRDMGARIDFLTRVYSIFDPVGDMIPFSMDTITHDDAVSAYRIKFGDDGKDDETIICALEILRGNLAKAAEIRPQDAEITATANAVADELLSAARTLHAMGEKKLPAFFAKTMSRLPKTPQTTADAGTIAVLFSGFPLKN